MKEYLFPKKIVKPTSAIAPQNLLRKQLLQIGLAERYTSTFEKGDFVILDYGKEMCGGIRILTFLANNTKVRIRFGESIAEACSELGGKRNATNDYAVRDFMMYLPSYSDQIFANTGFRFVRVDFHGDFGAYCYEGFRHSLCHGWAAGVIQFIKEECQNIWE